MVMSNDTKNFKLLRGARIIQQMDETHIHHPGCGCDAHLEEASYGELERNTLNFIPKTKKRQFAMAPLQVQGMEFTPYPNANNLLVEGIVKNNDSETERKTGRQAVYNPKILFQGVEFHQPENEEEVADPNTLTIEAKNGREFTISPIMLNQINTRVYCNCLDFFWRFSFYAHKQQALLGYDVGTYRKKTNRPPVNPQQKPALCKHLLQMAVELKNSKVVK